MNTETESTFNYLSANSEDCLARVARDRTAYHQSNSKENSKINGHLIL